MKKTINWEPPKKQLNPNSMEVKVKAQQVSLESQREASELLNKAFEPMRALLEMRLAKRSPLTIMRTLVYNTSDLAGADDDDGFYQIRKSSDALGKFVDQQKEIPVGEVIILKSLYPAMREFIFEDSRGREHAISYDQRNLLMTNTDIYEAVADFMGKVDNS